MYCYLLLSFDVCHIRLAIGLVQTMFSVRKISGTWCHTCTLIVFYKFIVIFKMSIISPATQQYLMLPLRRFQKSFVWRVPPIVNSGLPKVIFLAIAEAEGEGGKTSALEVEAKGEGKGLVFCIYVFSGLLQA